MASNAVEQPDARTKDRRDARRFVAWTVPPLLSIVVARETIGGETVLLDALPLTLQVICYALGSLLGCALAWIFWTLRRVSGASIAKTVIASIGVIPMAIITSTYVGRWAFEIASFADAPAYSHRADLKIMGVRSGKSGTFVQLRSSADSREIDAKITGDLYNELAAIRPPLWSMDFSKEPFCMTLDVEHGRWKSVRARVPARWQSGLGNYHVCGQAAAGG